MDERYGRVAALLHWAIAALILLNLATGFLRGLFGGMALHFSCGITILVLTLARVAWRLTHEPPPMVSSTTPVERALARTVHLGLYAAMTLMPLIGWAIVSSHPLPAPPGTHGGARSPAPRSTDRP